MSILRRVRGLVGTAVVWAFGWAFVAVAVHTIIGFAGFFGLIGGSVGAVAAGTHVALAHNAPADARELPPVE